MNFLTQKDIKHFDKFGYALVESGLENTQTLLDAQKAYEDIFNYVESGKYPYFRIYFDYFGKKNISGIEMPFHSKIIKKNIVAFLNASNLVKGTKDILKGKLKLELSRYHMTREEFGLAGNWHRDGDIGESQILQVNIFLFDEKGLEVIPMTHIKKSPGAEEEINKNSFTSLKESVHLKSKAGNILFFNPAILHRGFCSGFRANIHFRFSIDSNFKHFDFDNAVGFNQDWAEILSNKNSVITDSYIKKYMQPKGVLYLLKKSIRTFIHYVFFLFPNNFILFKKFNIHPNFKLRKIFYKNI